MPRPPAHPEQALPHGADPKYGRTDPQVPPNSDGTLSLGTAVRAERTRVLRNPQDELLTITINALLVCLAWFLLPTKAKDSVFPLHGPLAFPLILIGWMLADTPATNVLAKDPELALRTLTNPRDFGQVLRAKRIVLIAIVVPIVVLVAAGIGISKHDLWATLYIVAVLLILPYGMLAISVWLGIVFPYHPRPVTWRWKQARGLRKLIRWVTLVCMPYVLVPLVGALLLVPSAFVANAVSDAHKNPAHVTAGGFVAGTAVAALTVLLAVIVGNRVTRWLIKRRREPLSRYLSDPDRG
jgi:hypothetical protein